MNNLNQWQMSLQQDNLADGAQRLAAIDPTRSFIVQAPAGSGKTALLTQRFLALLTCVQSPEQIVAMTFTKKAAAEMRERVLHALQQGLLETCNSDRVYDQNTWKLAREVLQRDRDQAWCLLENPNRLRIKTLDSMNGYLVQQMPFLSKLGTQPRLNENNDALYIEAARAVLRSEDVSTETAALLSLVNGRYARAEALLVSMLKNRDQWMRLILSAEGRETMQEALAQLVQAELSQASMKLDALLQQGAELPELAAFALSNKSDADLQHLAQANWPLTIDFNDIAAWRELANFLLTQKGELRKTVTVANGFPTSNKPQKEKMVGVLAALHAHLSITSIEALADLATLPDPHYTDEQWHALENVITLLKHAVAHLTLAFKSAGQADFIEVAQAAAMALGDEDHPTDLALQLDYQLQHLLIDEFQDTSVGQFDLLKKLLRGWQPNDGRTLFIVGDPMQSIYRFREAEVGNFMQTWQGDALPVNLTTLNLTVNFRSNAGLVNWFNQNFKKVFPAQNQLVLGGVRYEAAVASPLAIANDDGAQHVFGHWALNQTQPQEAELMIELIRDQLAEWDRSEQSGNTIAILGRSRSHLAHLARGLKQQGIAFRAVELEALNERQEIQDLLALSRALLHAADRGAWLALLRAPLIGLDLMDLYALCGADKTKLYAPLTQILDDHQAWPALSSTGQQRLHQAWSVLENSLRLFGQQPFSRVVHQAWLALGGAQTVDSEVELENTQVFFEGLAAFDGEALNQQKLDDWITKLYASGDSSPAAQRVQLMTMHKSKGLQFTCVMLPALGKKPRSDDKALVSWLEFASDKGDGLVLAPLDQKGGSSSDLNKLIAKVEQQKQAFEDVRLLYVAATRAEHTLHLFGSVSFSLKQAEKDKPLVAQAKSLLAPLWSQVSKEFAALTTAELERLEQVEADADVPITDVTRSVPLVKRLPLRELSMQAWRQPNPLALNLTTEAAQSSTLDMDDEASIERLNALQDQADQVDHQGSVWAGLTARAVGNLVHALLEQMVHQGLDAWPVNRVSESAPLYQLLLGQAGVREQDLTAAVKRVQTSLLNALNNAKVRWALDHKLAESATELALTSKFERVENHIVDRCFVDEHGVRWIVDYKTSALKASDAEGYIEQLVADYQPQLQRYGELFQQLENRPQKWVLYFTEFDRWVEIN